MENSYRSFISFKFYPFFRDLHYHQLSMMRERRCPRTRMRVRTRMRSRPRLWVRTRMRSRSRMRMRSRFRRIRQDADRLHHDIPRGHIKVIVGIAEIRNTVIVPVPAIENQSVHIGHGIEENGHILTCFVGSFIRRDRCQTIIADICHLVAILCRSNRGSCKQADTQNCN